MADTFHFTQAESKCCMKALNNASLAGALDSAKVFNCPACGSEFTRHEYGPLVRWDYVPVFAIVAP
jgi:transposase-like protein